VIHAGDVAEVKEKKDFVKNALHATRATVDEAILLGGGV
jgi:chaperonin GroEL (HSP60 family)